MHPGTEQQLSSDLFEIKTAMQRIADALDILAKRLRMSTQDEILQMIQDCESRESKLTDWERGFIESIQSQLAKGKSLSPKQDEKLSSIWEKITEDG